MTHQSTPARQLTDALGIDPARNAITAATHAIADVTVAGRPAVDPAIAGHVAVVAILAALPHITTCERTREQISHATTNAAWRSIDRGDVPVRQMADEWAVRYVYADGSIRYRQCEHPDEAEQVAADTTAHLAHLTGEAAEMFGLMRVVAVERTRADYADGTVTTTLWRPLHARGVANDAG